MSLQHVLSKTIMKRGGLGVVQLHPAGIDGKTVAPSMSAGVLAFVDMQMC